MVLQDGYLKDIGHQSHEGIMFKPHHLFFQVFAYQVKSTFNVTDTTDLLL